MSESGGSEATPIGRLGAGKDRGATGYISWPALAFMTTATVAGLQPAPVMAEYGLACVTLYAVAAVCFFLPTALVSAELASGWEGGVYNWVSRGISPRAGFFAVWCQFAQTIFFYPSLLTFVASTMAYAIEPSLASSGVYIGVVIVAVYWLGVAVTSRGGAKAVAWLASGGLWIGTLIPVATFLVLGVLYLLQGNAPAAPMDASHLFPKWAGLASLVLIVNTFCGYSGTELNAVHVNEMRDPRRAFPRGMFLAIPMILCIFIFPALAISWVVPVSNLSLTAGVMEAFEVFFGRFGVAFLTPVFAVLIVCAMVSSVFVWLDGPSKGLLLIGRQQGYLPPVFQRVNASGIQQNILVAQGIVVTVVALMYALVPNVTGVYWIFTVVSIQVYLIMYLLVFVAAARLRRREPDHERGYRAPALTLLCSLGFFSSLAAFLIGFVPPSQFGDGNPVVYVAIVAAGALGLGLLVPFLLLRFRRPGWKMAGSDGVEETDRG